MSLAWCSVTLTIAHYGLESRDAGTSIPIGLAATERIGIAVYAIMVLVA